MFHHPVVHISLVFIAIGLASCSQAPTLPSSNPSSPDLNTTDLGITNLDRLKRQHRQWVGTPYRLGGLSRKGVDCSGFVYLTYKQLFDTALPRTTDMQSRTGVELSKNQLQAGDLVFFKTSRKVRHVGIYLEKGKFLHASTSRGVMISKLDNPYWKSRYWKSIRIINTERHKE